jgi:hypothetical protein
MLYEISKVRQVPGEGFRRWFTDTDHDLVIWYPDRNTDRIDGFQFSYNKKGDEHALTWTRERGFEHHRIDAGEVPYANKMSPVLVADGVPDVKTLVARFDQVSQRIDAEISAFVREKLESAGA